MKTLIALLQLICLSPCLLFSDQGLIPSRAPPVIEEAWGGPYIIHNVPLWGHRYVIELVCHDPNCECLQERYNQELPPELELISEPEQAVEELCNFYIYNWSFWGHKYVIRIIWHDRQCECLQNMNGD